MERFKIHIQNSILIPFKMMLLMKVVISGLLGCSYEGLEDSESHQQDQIELMKQWEGSWKIENSQDTIIIGSAKFWGTAGMLAQYKLLIKGEIMEEVKMLYGYDIDKDKIIETSLFKGGKIEIYTLYFVSETEYLRIPYEDVLHNIESKSYMKGEMVSPDTIIEIWYQNERPVYKHTWIRED